MSELKSDISFDDFDEMHYPRPGVTDFQKITDTVLSRRSFLGKGVAFGTAAFVMGTTSLAGLSGCAFKPEGFQPVEANDLDTITIPEGYSWHVVSMWGEPLWSKSADFDPATRGTGESQELAVGDNNDGMALFEKDGKSVLVSNNE